MEQPVNDKTPQQAPRPWTAPQLVVIDIAAVTARSSTPTEATPVSGPLS